MTASTLDGIALLRDLPAGQREQLAAQCRWRDYRPHQEIFSREHPTRDVFFVATGKVRVVNWSYSGREVSFDDIAAGGIFGELAAIDGDPRSASVVALENTTVGSVDPETFIKLILEHPETARHLFERLAAMVRRGTNRIFELSVLGANIRIYADLLQLAEDGKTGENSAEIRPIPVHSDIAARVSTTRETVARVMGDLSRREIVVRKSDRLVVPDVDLLAELIEE